MKSSKNNREYNEELVKKLLEDQNEMALGDLIRKMKAEHDAMPGVKVKTLTENERKIELIILNSMIENSKSYATCMRLGISPKDAQARFLGGKTVEEYRDIMLEKLDLYKFDEFKRAYIEAITQDMIDERYNSVDRSELVKGLLSNVSDREVRIQYQQEKHHYVTKTKLLFNKAGEEELYRRSGLEKELGLTYHELSGALGSKLDAFLITNPENNSCEILVFHNNGLEISNGNTVHLSKEEQALFANAVEKKLIYTSHENHVARHLSNTTIQVTNVENPELMTRDFSKLRVKIDVTKESFDELIKMSGIDEDIKLSGRTHVYKPKYEVYAEFTPYSTDKSTDDIKIMITGPRLEGYRIVPCKIADKQEALKKTLECLDTPSVKSYLKKAGWKEKEKPTTRT